MILIRQAAIKSKGIRTMPAILTAKETSAPKIARKVELIREKYTAAPISAQAQI